MFNNLFEGLGQAVSRHCVKGRCNQVSLYPAKAYRNRYQDGQCENYMPLARASLSGIVSG